MKIRSVVALFSLAAIFLHAQTERGNITGTVTDTTQAAVAGASVVVTNTATNQSTSVRTTDTGAYNVPNLPPGPYRLEVSLQGFKQVRREGLTLTAAATLRVDATLEVGQVSETVEVNATVAQVQTENAKVTTAVQNRLVDELPLVVGGALRSPFDLVRITSEARASGSRIALGGGQVKAWEATLDGVSVTTNRSADAAEIAYTTPSLEAITEFAVDTNGFKAEYGQAGGGVMTFSSKSGTNEWHGSAYDFLRNEKLDARGFFAKSRSIYKQNDFGASLGGPVRIPKLYDGRNRTFFFVAYEGFRNRVGANDTIRSVPTPEMYNGDFSNWVDSRNNLLQIYDPATTRPNPAGSGFVRTPFAGNQIPTSRFAAFTKTVLPYGQAIKPNRGGVPGTIGYVQNNFITTSGTLLNPQDKGSLRFDHAISANHKLGYFYNGTSYCQEVGAGGPPDCRSLSGTARRSCMKPNRTVSLTTGPYPRAC